MRMSEIKILIADDHPIIRTGVRATFDSRAEFCVVGEAVDGSGVLPRIHSLRPDLLILDLEMPGDSTSSILAECGKHYPELKILILSGHTGLQQVAPLRGLPIRGFVLKREAADCLLQAVRVIAAGETWFSHEIQPLLSPPSEDTSPLTQREAQVYELMRAGKDNGTIAAELLLSKQTIRRYATVIYEKLGVKNRVEAILC